MKKTYQTTNKQQKEGLVKRIPYYQEMGFLFLLLSIPIIGNIVSLILGMGLIRYKV